MKTVKYLLLLAMSVVTASSAIAEEKVLIMGYKDKDKMPLIGNKEDDSGLYKELFEKSASKIGYQLKIVRLPKKRVHKGLSDGTIDFYPGASFSKKRAEYLYYLPNGLQTKEVLISLNTQNEITNMSQANGRLLTEVGSSKAEWDKKYPGLEIIKLTKLPMESVVKALKAGRGDFFVADIEVVDYYKKNNNISNFNDIGIKVHHKAINSEFLPMYLGFSRKSTKLKEQTNSNYNSSNEVTVKNFQTVISKECAAYKFFSALEELSNNGQTQKNYDKYFK